MSQLEELRKKTIRPTVPQRTDGFSSSELDSEPESKSEQQTNVSNFPLRESNWPEQVPSSCSSLTAMSSKKRQKGVRLDEAIASELERFCLEEKITIETLIEAAWLEMQNHPKLRQKILKSAKNRRQKRFKLGRLQAKRTELAALETEVAKFLD